MRFFGFTRWIEDPSHGCTDYVDLSIGRIYIRPLTNGIINKVASKSTVYGSVLNNAFYFNLMEYELVKLKPKQQDALSVEDGVVLRNKVKEILTRHNLLSVEEKFTESEADIFRKQEEELLKRLRDKSA